jgi:hypothetical protein
MKRLSLGPAESDAGGVIIITAESAARWREDREKAASGKSDDPDEDFAATWSRPP